MMLSVALVVPHSFFDEMVYFANLFMPSHFLLKFLVRLSERLLLFFLLFALEMVEFR
jgi:hypothetical protein